MHRVSCRVLCGVHARHTEQMAACLLDVSAWQGAPLPAMGRRRVEYPGLGERVRELRLKKGWSQTVAAIETNYGARDSYAKVERNDVVPTSQSLGDIADAYGVTVEYLLYGGGGKPQSPPRREAAPAPRRAPPPPPPEDYLTEDEWVDMLGDHAPDQAIRLARMAWEMASGGAVDVRRGGTVHALRPQGVPTRSPATRSDDSSLVADEPEPPEPTSSGMRGKPGTRKSAAPRRTGRRR